MKKRLVATFSALTLIVSSVSVFAQSSFTDLNEFHAWAEPQINEMTTLGIIKGYTDGSFRPDQAITKTEALVLVSRAAGYTIEGYDTFKAASSERYNEVVEKYNTPYPNEVSFLLYKGVLTEDDLSAYISSDRASSPLLRYEMAELLTRLMRAEESVKASGQSISLTYSDAGEIPHDAVKYVNYVTNAALMQGVYDPEHPDDIFFKPYNSVTRAQMAVLLHRVLSKSNITVEYSTLVGKNVSANSLTYRDQDGKTVVFKLNKGINLIVDGVRTDNVSYASQGAQLAFFYIDNTLCDVEVVNTPNSKWDGIEKEPDELLPTKPVEGKITRIVMDETCTVTVDGNEYILSAASVIYVNHVASTIYDLRVGYDTELEFENGKVILVYSTSTAEKADDALEADGVITSLNVTNRSVYLEVENSETGVISEKELFIETGAVIINAISGKSIDFLSLNPDDHITAVGVLKNGKFYASKIIVR